MHDPNASESRLVGPRVDGVREHFYRAKWFVQLAGETSDPIANFRFLIAATYSARGIVEIMLEAAVRQGTKADSNDDTRQSRKDLEALLEGILPHYFLIEKVRIHDFHRFGCLPPDPNFESTFCGGPIKLIAQNGSAVTVLSTEGPHYILSGQSRVKEQRPLCQSNGRFYDDVSGGYLGLDRILTEYLSYVPQAINTFESLMNA